MNWQGVLGIVGTVSALAMGFLLWRATKQAALADGLRKIAEYQAKRLEAHRHNSATKEQYIRELEQTVVGNMPVGELANRLNSLFGQAADRRAADPVQPAKPATKPAGAQFRRVLPR